MITALVILSLGCILAYTLSVCIKFKGIPNSISASFYSLQHKYWFRFTMWLTPMLLIPAILEISDTNTQWLAYLACVGMIVVGCFPDYTGDKFYYRGHVAGAVITMVSSQVWVAFHAPVLLTAWALWLVYTMYSIYGYMNDKIEERGYEADGDFIQGFYSSKPMFWVEIVSLTTTYITIFFTL